MAFGNSRWLRALLVTAGVAAAFAGLVWMTVRGQTACEVCVVYRGREACREASATTSEEARRQAQSTACAMVTGGVTQDLECERSEPTRLHCE
jgi:hypothetical protein